MARNAHRGAGRGAGGGEGDSFHSRPTIPPALIAGPYRTR